MEADRYTFGQHGLVHLTRLKDSLESMGHTCTIEHEVVHSFTLHTLVAVPPKNEQPIKFTRSKA